MLISMERKIYLFSLIFLLVFASSLSGRVQSMRRTDIKERRFPPGAIRRGEDKTAII